MSQLRSWSRTVSRQRQTASIQSPTPSSQAGAASTQCSHADSAVDVSLQRHAGRLRDHLQELLDAQVAGLSAQQAPAHDDTTTSSTAFTTSSLTTTTRNPTTPVRQPRKVQLTLSASRAGISETMHALSLVSLELYARADRRVHDEQHASVRVSEWITRRSSLQRTIADTDRDPHTGGRLATLRDEAGAVQEQIDALESQLLELRSRQRAVQLELSAVTNTVEAQMSSYTAALALLDLEADRYITSTRLSTSAGDPLAKSVMGGNALEALQERTHKEEKRARRARDAYEEAVNALKEGAPVWARVVKTVSEYERVLGREIVRANDEDSAQRFPALLRELEDVIGLVETELVVAEAKGWTLLVCAIGAELEALTRGCEVLVGLSATSASVEKSNCHVAVDEVVRAPETSLMVGEDDEPGPDFLVSHVDTDHDD